MQVIQRDRPYTNEDIAKILDSVDDTIIKNHKRWYYRKPRARAMVHLLASSGISLREMSNLKYGDLEKIEDCYCINLNGRVAFCTPETRQSIEELVKLPLGITNESNLFSLNYDAARMLLFRLVKKSGISNEIDHTSWDYTKIMKLESPLMTGLKKRFDMLCDNYGIINPNHSKNGIISKEFLFNDYKKIIPSLTIY